MSQAPPGPATSIPPSADTGADTERLLAMLCYGLFLLAIANGVTALIGVVLAYLRRAPARGTLYASHYRNLIIVFWVSLAVGMVSFALLIDGALAGLAFLFWGPWRLDLLGWTLPLAVTGIPLALLAGLLFAIWYLYRVLKGFARALDEKPY